MKKLLFAIVLFCSAPVLHAQVKLPAAAEAVKGFIKPPAIGDITSTTSGIVKELAGKLGLAATQQPALTDAVGSFLKSKNGIMSLADSKPADYLSKFNPLQSGLFAKLKTIMGAAKFASFLKLKPTGNGAGNILSNLFF